MEAAMPSAFYGGAVLVGMLAVGLTLAAWPDRVQAVAFRYANKGWPASPFKRYIESNAYPAICRVIGVIAVVLACFGLMVLVVSDGE
jgi:hypothetical protein